MYYTHARLAQLERTSNGNYFRVKLASTQGFFVEVSDKEKFNVIVADNVTLDPSDNQTHKEGCCLPDGCKSAVLADVNSVYNIITDFENMLLQMFRANSTARFDMSYENSEWIITKISIGDFK